MRVEVLIPDLYRDRLEFETVGNYVFVHLFCQFIQDALYQLFVIHILLKGDVSSY